MLQFNESKLSVSYKEVQVELQPLNFRLLKLLWQHLDRVVTNEEIFSAVWDNRSVSPETLKQRIFLLRKAISAAGVDDIEIKSIRGEGYRLFVDDAPYEEHKIVKDNVDETQTTTKLLKVKPWHTVAVFVVIVSLFVAFKWAANETKVNTNNRLAIWFSESTPSEKLQLKAVKQALMNKAAKFEDPYFQVLFNDYDENISIPNQSRAKRVGLILILESLDEFTVMARIIEPRTSTVLYSYQMQQSQSGELIGGTKEVFHALERLFKSNKLVLNKSMLVDATHPIWQELRELAKGD